MVSGQPVSFGSADDPMEAFGFPRWQSSVGVEAMGGFSLIGAQWRTAGNFSVEYLSQSISARADGTIRAGIYGTYDRDMDETYDIARLIRYVRIEPSRSSLYLRIGSTNRLRLGTGHVVNFYSSRTDWDDRSIGIEATWGGRFLRLSAFADNFLLDRVIGGRVAWHPLSWARDEKARSLELGAAYVLDRRRVGLDRALEAYNFDLQFTAANIGDILLKPFATFSWYEDAGSGLGVGGELASDNFVDVARFRLRVAVYYSEEGFIPGYVGSFYRVSSPLARILKSEDLSPTDSVGAVAGYSIADANRATSLETELRLLFFGRFELWYNFRRHFGSQALSEYHVRLYFRAGRINAYIAQDRGGLRHFFTLFNDLGDQTSMEFQTDYRFTPGFWLFVRARYSYEEVERAADGTHRFVVQRRFEPFSGFRWRF